jgi:ATP-dependent Clp protease ATP-binding subunit ClpC
VFERFTERARRTLTLAQEEARLLNHGFIGTEHILLGLMVEGSGIGATALTSMGISYEDARREVEKAIGFAGAPTTGSPPFTPRAKKVLELSLREALAMNHSYIGTEHILLGLIREGEGVAANVLMILGADLTRVRGEILKLLSGHQGTREASETHPHVSGVASIHAEPACPHCRAEITVDARFRRIAVSSESDVADQIEIEVVYCTRCGTTLHIFKVNVGSPDDQD